MGIWTKVKVGWFTGELEKLADVVSDVLLPLLLLGRL